jgi:alkylation response protein AidB-like acyl-CoA dehydrogenase
MMLGVVLPLFQVGSAAVGIGIAEAAVQATIGHVTHARFEESNSSLADLPTLRAQIARCASTRIARGRTSAPSSIRWSRRAGDAVDGARGQGVGHRNGGGGHRTGDADVRRRGLRRAHGIERLFRDARAPIVMAPTSDVAYEFIGRALCGLEVF